MSAAVVWLTVHFALSTRSFLAINVALSLAWLGLAIALGRGYMRRSARAAARPEPFHAGCDVESVVTQSLFVLNHAAKMGLLRRGRI